MRTYYLEKILSKWGVNCRRGSGGRGFISGAGETELQLQWRRFISMILISYVNIYLALVLTGPWLWMSVSLTLWNILVFHNCRWQVSPTKILCQLTLQTFHFYMVFFLYQPLEYLLIRVSVVLFPFYLFYSFTIFSRLCSKLSKYKH